MTPALYYPWVYLKGGAERVLVQLMTRSRHDWTLYTNRFEPESTFPEFHDLSVVVLDEISVRRNVVDVARAGITLLRQTIDANRHDSLFIVSEGLGNLMALRSRLPTSCICLTPLKVAYDDATRERYVKRGQRFHELLAARVYARVERPAWRRYRRVFCNSRETMRRILAAGLVEASRLEVAYHGVDLDRFRPRGRREAYFLAPGRITWTKNLELVLDAWTRFKPEPADNAFRLIVAGMVDVKSAPYLQSLRTMVRGRADVQFVLSPSDDALAELYASAHAVVFAAPNEDLGLVPLEAMASGKPVLAVDRGGPRETVIDGETGLLRADRPAAFAEALARLAAMPDPDLEAMGVYARARSLEFSWDRFAERIDEHADEIALRRPVMV